MMKTSSIQRNLRRQLAIDWARLERLDPQAAQRRADEAYRDTYLLAHRLGSH